MMDNIKEFVNSFTSSEQVKEFLADVSRICKSKNSELRSREKAARAELKKIAVTRASDILAHTASGSIVRVLFKKEAHECEFITAKPDQFVVKMNGKKRSFPYHKLVVS